MNYLQISSHKTATWMTVAVSIVGLTLLIGGAAMTGIAYTEVRPNYADDNYNRYTGAHLQRTVGPVLLVFGTVLLVGGCLFMGFVMFAHQNRHHSSKLSSKTSSRREVY